LILPNRGGKRPEIITVCARGGDHDKIWFAYRTENDVSSIR